MALIGIKVPWTSKPDHIVPIDRGNPLTKGLEHLYIATPHGMYDLVGQRYASNPSASINTIPSVKGRLRDYDAVNLEYDAIELKDRSVATFGHYSRADSLSNDNRFTALGKSTNASPLFALGVSVSSPSYLSRTFCRYDNFSIISVGSSADNLIYNGDYVAVTTTSNGATIKQRLNDQLVTFGTVGSPTTLTCDRIAFGGIQRTTASNKLDCSVALVWLYNRELSEAESAKLHENVWQLLRPRTIYIESGGLSPVSSLSNFLWNIHEEASNTADFRWNVLESIGQNLQAVWDLLSEINNTTDLRWDIYAEINNTLQAIWNITSSITPVSNTSDFRWDLYSEINNTTDIRWDLFEAISNTLDAEWDLNQEVSSTLDARWNIYAEIANTLQAMYNILNEVSNTSQFDWHLFTEISNTVQTLWDIVSSITSVGNTVDVRWNTDEQISNTLDARWHLFTEIASNLDTRWDLLTSLGVSTDLRWNILNEAANQLSTKWDILTEIGSTVEVMWDSASQVGSTVSLKWNIQTLSGVLPIEVIVIPAEGRIISISAEGRVVTLN